MHQKFKYSSIIFDCDGVLLDSNDFKIEAMREALCNSGYPTPNMDNAIALFKSNFGMSRFFHVEKFIELLEPCCLMAKNKEESMLKILNAYSLKCRSAYKNCDVIEGVIDFLRQFNGDMYVASGSEEAELKAVLDYKGMSSYFVTILGSPVKKSENIKTILEGENKQDFVMIGDSIADFVAAKDNGIDFIFFSPFSNTKEEMLKLATDEYFSTVGSFIELKSII